MIPEIEGNRTNILIARSLNKLRVTHMGGHIYYDGRDYENDLDAIIEAVQTLADDQKQVYITALIRMLPSGLGLVEGNLAIHNAPAKIRCSAYLEACDG